MIKKNYSILNALYRKTSEDKNISERYSIKNALYLNEAPKKKKKDNKPSGGQGAQNQVAAYLIQNIDSVVRCIVAPPKTNWPDVVALDENDKIVCQCEVKDISSSKFDGYAEVHEKSSQKKQKTLRDGFNWQKGKYELKVDGSSCGNTSQKQNVNSRIQYILKPGGEDVNDLLKQKSDQAEPGLEDQDKRKKWYIPVYALKGAKAQPTIDDVKEFTNMNWSSAEGIIASLFPDSDGPYDEAKILELQKQGQNPEDTVGFYRNRRSYGDIYSSVILTYEPSSPPDVQYQIRLIDYPGVFCGEAHPDRPYGNIASDLSKANRSKYDETGRKKGMLGSYKWAAEADRREMFKKTDDIGAQASKCDRLRAGGCASKVVKNVKPGDEAKWEPNAGAGFDATMKKHYSDDSDNYFVKVRGSKLHFIHTGGSNPLNAKTGKFIPCDSKGNDLSNAGQIEALSFVSGYAAYFKLEGGKPDTLSYSVAEKLLDVIQPGNGEQFK